MKKFIIKLSLFIILFIGLDLALGCIFKFFDYTKSGEIHKVHDIATKQSPEIIVVGSSRASHHYVSAMIKDSLGASFYNAGLDGRGLVTGYGLLKCMEEREAIPKYIICDIMPVIDLIEGSYPLKLDDLYPYSYIDDVRQLIISADNTERFKLLLNSYKLNSKLLRVLPSIFSNRSSRDDGYLPLSGDMTLCSHKDSSELRVTHTLEFTIDPIREKYIRKLIEEFSKKDTKLIFAVSPYYGKTDEEPYLKEISIVKEYGIPVINHLNDPRFIDNPELFTDSSHLNNKGAILYTDIIIKELDSIFRTAYL